MGPTRAQNGPKTVILAKNRSDYNGLRRDHGGSNPPDAPDSQIWVPGPGGAKTAQIQEKQIFIPPYGDLLLGDLLLRGGVYGQFTS